MEKYNLYQIGYPSPIFLNDCVLLPYSDGSKIGNVQAISLETLATDAILRKSTPNVANQFRRSSPNTPHQV